MGVDYYWLLELFVLFLDEIQKGLFVVDLALEFGAAVAITTGHDDFGEGLTLADGLGGCEDGQVWLHVQLVYFLGELREGYLIEVLGVVELGEESDCEDHGDGEVKRECWDVGFVPLVLLEYFVH